MSAVEHDEDAWDVGPPPAHQRWRPPLVRKPDDFDELFRTHREMSRERWFDEDGRHRAYAAALAPPAPHRPEETP